MYFSFVTAPLLLLLLLQAMRESGLSKAHKGSGGGSSSGARASLSGLDIGKHVLGPDVDADATITGFVLQQHLPTLLDFLAHRTSSLR